MLIVFIDDAVDNLKLFKIYTKALSHECHFFSNPEEGLQALKDLNVDLCFVDIQMPGLDGKELIKKYFEFCETHNKKRAISCALTGTTVDSEVEQILNAGFDRHIIKPILKKQIIELIEGISSEQ